MGIFRDKVIINKHYNTNDTTVIQKRAPTDESVKLLKEFEEKAESKFCERIDIKTNLLDYTILEYAECLDHWGSKFRYFVKINDKDYQGDIQLDRYEIMKQPMLLFQEIQKDLAEKISKEIIIEKINNQTYNAFIKRWKDK